VSLGPVVASAALGEDKIVRAEKLAKPARLDGVEDAWFKVDHDGSWNVVTGGALIKVDRCTLKLFLGLVPDKFTELVNTMLGGEDLPKCGADGVAALAGLQAHNAPAHLSALGFAGLRR
jgi:hypothetical protein